MATGKFLPDFAEGQGRMEKKEEASFRRPFFIFYALFITLRPNY